MAILDWVLLVITLVVVALSFIVITSLGASIQRASGRVQELVGLLSASALTTLQAVRTVRAANATTRKEDEAVEVAREARHAGIRLAKIAAVISPVSGLATQVSFLAVIGVGGYRVASGDLTIADLVAFILFLFMLVMPLSQAFEAVTAVNQALGAYSRIDEILGSAQEVDEVDGQGITAPGPTSKIEFLDVGMSYSGDVPVLSDISFRVLEGTRVALVGPSGAGKSTILQTIERFYPISQGSIRVDGVDVADIAPRAA